ncbi:hypothetical protein OVA24_10660 [Luteolibacter sp. SL250]|uniref:hypothetical protein n=1 Tax=Luteolibacter sp. SL250 TaxID=2995170 RepID=UPI002271B12E|nr:hypothetical protein [Luteolibacter sp. SL250]WAC21844.1 hypothetical protein OVA24_10660 [Luteolibacter sp. SL250]
MNPSLSKLIQQIMEIDREIEDLSVPGDLFSSKTFIALYENPGGIIEDARTLLRHLVLTPKQKQILAYSLQKLPAEEYRNLVSHVIDGVIEDETDLKTLEVLTFPSFDWGGGLVKTSDTPETIELVKRLLELEKFPPGRKTYIQTRVLNGTAKKELIDYQEMYAEE